MVWEREWMLNCSAPFPNDMPSRYERKSMLILLSPWSLLGILKRQVFNSVFASTPICYRCIDLKKSLSHTDIHSFVFTSLKYIPCLCRMLIHIQEKMSFSPISIWNLKLNLKLNPMKTNWWNHMQNDDMLCTYSPQIYAWIPWYIHF